MTPTVFEPGRFAELLGKALDAGDVAAVQLRLKHADDEAWRRAIVALRPVAQSRGVAFLLNDRPDLVRAHGCDGAHVGQQDMPVQQARAVLGDALTLGVSCHGSRELAMQAGEAGADYVAFGAFFESPTKAEASRAEIEVIEWWAELMTLPCVAIGGITAENSGALVQAGADFLAVCSAVWDHPAGPGAAVEALNQAIAAASARQ